MEDFRYILVALASHSNQAKTFGNAAAAVRSFQGSLDGEGAADGLYAAISGSSRANL